MGLPQFDDLPFNARPDLTPYLIHLTKNTATYSAAADLAKWDRAMLDRQDAVAGAMRLKRSQRQAALRS